MKWVQLGGVGQFSKVKIWHYDNSICVDNMTVLVFTTDSVEMSVFESQCCAESNVQLCFVTFTVWIWSRPAREPARDLED